MATQHDEDLKTVLRSLKLAQAQLKSLKKDCSNDPAKQGEIEDAEVALVLLIKKLNSLLP